MPRLLIRLRVFYSHAYLVLLFTPASKQAENIQAALLKVGKDSRAKL